MIQFPPGAPSGPVIAHTDAARTRSLIPGKRDRQGFLQAHLDELETLFNGRPAWFPTFNYDFLRTRTFDADNDPSQVGSINEAARVRKMSWRSPIPVFNFTGTGVAPALQEITEGAIIYPFDQASTFGRIVAEDGILLWYGAPFSTATILHHAEAMADGPPYRYDKDFQGTVFFEGASTGVTLRYHVRPLSRPVDYAWDRIVPDAQKQGIIRVLDAPASVSWASARELTNFWVERQREDALYLLDEKSRRWIAPKLDHLGRRFILEDFEGTGA